MFLVFVSLCAYMAMCICDVIITVHLAFRQFAYPNFFFLNYR